MQKMHVSRNDGTQSAIGDGIVIEKVHIHTEADRASNQPK
jgi:hypothetical protein